MTYADILLGVGSGDSHETADIDRQIKPEHDTLGGRLGILNDPFARLEGDHLGNGGGNLVQKQGRNIRLKHGYRGRVISSNPDMLE